jgi:hypothetical protein
VRARSSRRAGLGLRRRARDVRVSGPPKSGPILTGTQLPFADLFCRALRDCSNASTSPSSTSSSLRLVFLLISGARLGVVKRAEVLIDVAWVPNYIFVPSMIRLELILLLQRYILDHFMSMFTYVRFPYVIFIVVMIYLWINLKLKLLFFPSATRGVEETRSLQIILLISEYHDASYEQRQATSCLCCCPCRWVPSSWRRPGARTSGPCRWTSWAAPAGRPPS